MAGVWTGGLVAGLPYYRLSEDARWESELRAVFGPGGVAGLGFGVLGTALMVALLVYSGRKWWIRESRLGRSTHWLRFHIVCGVAGPAFILLHTAFSLPSGLIAVGFWCMVLVVVSGVLGRYVRGRTRRGLLRWWNLFHHPLAFAMYGIVAIHIASSVLFGGALTVLVGGVP